MQELQLYKYIYIRIVYHTVTKINYQKQLQHKKNNMDNQSNDSDRQLDIGTQTKKPTNRTKFIHNNITISSQFSGGNIKSALFQQQFRMEGKIALVIQFWGNSDAQSDPLDKSWFYFSISGIRDGIQKNKYEEIIFRFKNANNLRKFIRQKRFKPYVVFRQGTQNTKNYWQTLYISKMNILQNQIIQAQFIYTVKPGIDYAQFAQNLPYSFNDVNQMYDSMQQFIQHSNNNVYCHRQIVATSTDGYPVYMFTVTSNNNVISQEERQPVLWDSQITGRPFLMKNIPQIVITARVHPSETSSSFCIHGLFQALIKNYGLDILKHMFIFRILPMLNPDGVENGHYRLDNYLQNLNRYYGHSNPNTTPSIYPIQKIITHLRQKSKLFLFMDIHGHNSPKYSFIYGNFSQNFNQILQNKTFVKVLQALNDGNFDAQQSQFSKRNMTVKQKYDQHSKEASARVFAYRGHNQQQNMQNDQKNSVFVQHSYTFQVHPYAIQETNFRKNIRQKQMSNSYKNLPKLITTYKKIQSINSPSVPSELQTFQIIEQYKKLGQSVLIAILEIIGANSFYKLQLTEDSQAIRKKSCRDITKQLQFYDRNKKMRYKQINKEQLQRYYQKWNFLELYKQYLYLNSENEMLVNKLKSSPMHEAYLQLITKRQEKKQLYFKKSKILSKLGEKIIYPKHCSASEQDQPIQKQTQFQQRLESLATISQSKKEVVSSNKIPKNTKPLKTIQFEMLQKNEFQQRISNSKPMQNYNTNHFKKPGSQISEIQALEKRIRKLMFRHKTQVQLPENEDQYVAYEIPVDYLQGNNIQKQQTIEKKNGIHNKKTKINSRLQPLQKQKKAKVFHLKTEDNKFKLQFNDHDIVKRMDQVDKGIFDNSKFQNLQGLQPRFKQFMKKLSAHKIQHETIQQVQKIQSHQKIMHSNLINEQKKIGVPRNSYQHLKQSQKIIPNQQNYRKYIAVFAGNTIDSIKNEKPVHRKVNQQPDNTNNLNGRISNCHKSVKSKLQNSQIVYETNNNKQLHDIIKSFRVLASQTNNKQQFLQKAKKVIVERKKQPKQYEEKILPLINEFDSIQLKQKSKSKSRSKYIML